MTPPTPREAVGFRAQMALHLGRHNDLVEAMRVLAEQHNDLTVQEKQFIWTGYQSVFLDKHHLLKKLDALGKEHDRSKFFLEIETYQNIIQFEMMDFCTKSVGFVEKHLLTSCVGHESVRWNKMIGDLCWYQLKLTREDENKDILVHKALTAYKMASIAAEDMPFAHPDRLVVLLNLSEFYFDEMSEEDIAMAMAEDGVHRSSEHMDLLDEDSRKETIRILELINENLMKWSAQKAAKAAAVLSDTTRSSIADGSVETQEKSAATEADMKLAPEPEPDHELELDPETEPEADPEPDPEPTKEVYSTRSPSPVRTRCVSPLPRLTFVDPPPAGPEEDLTRYQIRQRKKASQARRGMMG